MPAKYAGDVCEIEYSERWIYRKTKFVRSNTEKKNMEKSEIQCKSCLAPRGSIIRDWVCCILRSSQHCKRRLRIQTEICGRVCATITFFLSTKSTSKYCLIIFLKFSLLFVSKLLLQLAKYNFLNKLEETHLLPTLTYYLYAVISMTANNNIITGIYL